MLRLLSNMIEIVHPINGKYTYCLSSIICQTVGYIFKCIILILCIIYPSLSMDNRPNLRAYKASQLPEDSSEVPHSFGRAPRPALYNIALMGCLSAILQFVYVCVSNGSCLPWQLWLCSVHFSLVTESHREETGC